MRKIIYAPIVSLDGYMVGSDGDLGGATLAEEFIRHDLVDEYRLYIYPVRFGGGKPMFPVSKQIRNLHLSEMQTFDGGVIMLCNTSTH